MTTLAQTGDEAPPPLMLSATAGVGQVSLSWNAAAFDFTHPTFLLQSGRYDIYRATVPGDEGDTPYATISADDDDAPNITYVDTNVTDGTAYFYKIVAVLTTTSVGRPHRGDGDTTTSVLNSSGQVRVTPVAPAVHTADWAIGIAQAFCQAIGQPVTDPATAVYPVPDESLDNTGDNHYLPRWKVTFAKADDPDDQQAELEVVDANGVVTGYYNYMYSRTIQDDLLAGPLLSQSDALQRAASVLQATGQTDDFLPPVIDLHQSGDKLHKGDSFWDVDWRPLYQGIPYHSAGGFVNLDAETGTILYAGLNYWSAPPASMDVTITQAQALSIVQAQLASSGIQGATENTFQPFQLMIVTPSTFWQDGNEDDQPTGSRVAWVYAFDEPNDNVGEVFVDAQTGEVIGGTEAKMRGAKITTKPKAAVKKKTVVKKKATLSKVSKPKKAAAHPKAAGQQRKQRLSHRQHRTGKPQTG